MKGELEAFKSVFDRLTVMEDQESNEELLERVKIGEEGNEFGKLLRMILGREMMLER
jgi:hypothetical protein